MNEEPQNQKTAVTAALKAMQAIVEDKPPEVRINAAKVIAALQRGKQRKPRRPTIRD